jgi:putative CocE/NonD family hydrolase
MFVSIKFIKIFTMSKFIFACLFLAFIQNPIFAQDADILKKLQEIAVVDEKVMMPMRDGIRLATDIYRPKTDKPVPVIFSRTPYNFNAYRDGKLGTRNYETAMQYVKAGYAYVVQNERGRYFSEGEWDILGLPLTDGYDAFEWMKNQKWCNGKIATYGCSSTAEWQMAVAALDHPSHTTLVAQGYGAGVGKVGPFLEQGNWYRGGATQMLFISWLYGVQNDAIRPSFPKNATQEQLIRASRYFDLAPEHPPLSWKKSFNHLPVSDLLENVDGPVGIFSDMVARKPNDPKWFKGGLYHDNMQFNKPNYWFVSWFDVSSSPNIELFNHVRKNAVDPKVRDQQYLIIAPTLHCSFTRATENTMIGDLNVGDARLDYNTLLMGWYDHFLKGEKPDYLKSLPRVKYYTIGKNIWQTSETWPPANMQMQTLYLNSNGKANTMYGDGKLSNTKPTKDAPDSYYYDPMNPVPSNGGNVCCTGDAIQGGSYDQRVIETRQDVLVYTTEPFMDGVELSGPIEATFYVSSDAKDTDFTFKIIDVYPDGTAHNLDENIFRARYREGFDKEVFMQKDNVYEIKFSPVHLSNYFKKGHSLRIEVSSSNFPRFDRNLNTGGANYNESKGVVALNKIHHSDKYPSQIKIPMIVKK